MIIKNMTNDSENRSKGHFFNLSIVTEHSSAILFLGIILGSAVCFISPILAAKLISFIVSMFVMVKTWNFLKSHDIEEMSRGKNKY